MPLQSGGDKFVYLDERRCNVTCMSALVSDAYVNRTLFVVEDVFEGKIGLHTQLSEAQWPVDKQAKEVGLCKLNAVCT